MGARAETRTAEPCPIMAAELDRAKKEASAPLRLKPENEGARRAFARASPHFPISENAHPDRPAVSASLRVGAFTRQTAPSLPSPSRGRNLPDRCRESPHLTRRGRRRGFGGSGRG